MKNLDTLAERVSHGQVHVEVLPALFPAFVQGQVCNWGVREVPTFQFFAVLQFEPSTLLSCYFNAESSLDLRYVFDLVPVRRVTPYV